jgi:regulator of sigma E protease
VQSEGKPRIVELEQQPVKGWSLPIRGLRFEPLITETVISNPVKAVNMGIAQTRDFMSEIYLTLYRLVRGELPSRGLSGPIGIAKNAVSVASLGFSPLIFFLGYLSINLAVLNFLPIPLLDGGHMMFLLYEGLRGKPASERVLIAATYMGLAFVLSLMVFVLYLDIFVHWLKVG